MCGTESTSKQKTKNGEMLFHRRQTEASEEGIAKGAAVVVADRGKKKNR